MDTQTLEKVDEDIHKKIAAVDPEQAFFLTLDCLKKQKEGYSMFGEAILKEDKYTVFFTGHLSDIKGIPYIGGIYAKIFYTVGEDFFRLAFYQDATDFISEDFLFEDFKDDPELKILRGFFTEYINGT